MNWMKFLRVLLLPLAFLCVGLLRLLGGRVKLGEFISSRVGHLVGNTECYLCERSDGRIKSFDIWTHSGVISNKQIAKMHRRLLVVDPTRFVKLVAVCNTLFSGWEEYVAHPTQLDRDIYNLLEKYPPHLSFNTEEARQGEAGLRKLGIPLGAKWVYLIVRDDSKHPHLPYHSYRNADIDTYAEACIALAERGYYVIRMGAKVSKKLPATHHKVIDLATMGQTDFMGVYLGAHCSFCISTGTGPDSIPYAFRRPIVYTNYVPFEYFFTFAQKSLAIWKHHEKDGKRMTVKEIIESKSGQFMSSLDFEDAGITLVDNTPEEIRTVVLEMADLVEFKPSTTDQSQFWKDYPKSISPYNQQPLHGEIRMRIGSEFLKGYK